MARSWMKELTALEKRVDRNEKNIRDLQTSSVSDKETLRLQSEGLELLRKLGRNHEERLVRVETEVSRFRRAPSDERD